jgi:hypothetical protein
MERDHWDTLFDDLCLRTYARVDRGENDEQEALGAAPDHDLLLEERTFDYVAGEIETMHSLVEAGGNRESLTYRFRVYTATELVRLVEEAGFTAVECFGGWEREPLSRETRLILLAKVS